MVSRSIVPALLLSMASLATASATPPLRAAAAGSTAASLTVADAAQRVTSEKASVDAEIGALQIHIEELDAGSAASQVEASGIRGQADAYLQSAEAQLLKRSVDSYDASCVNRMLIGNQIYTCAIAHDKLQKLAARHNQTMVEFRRSLAEQNIRTRQIRAEIALTRNEIQDLQKYSAWLDSARETIAKTCGGLSAGAGSSEAIEPRCGQVPFDRVPADLPPCEAERCPAWAQP